MTARSTEEVVENSSVTAAVAATLFDALARALLKNRLETEMTDELDSNQRASMAREMMALLCRIATDGGVDVPLGGPLLPVIEALWGANPVKDVMAIPMPDFTRTVGPATAAQQHAAAYYTQQVGKERRLRMNSERINNVFEALRSEFHWSAPQDAHPIEARIYRHASGFRSFCKIWLATQKSAEERAAQPYADASNTISYEMLLVPMFIFAVSLYRPLCFQAKDALEKAGLLSAAEMEPAHTQVFDVVESMWELFLFTMLARMQSSASNCIDAELARLRRLYPAAVSQPPRVAGQIRARPMYP